VPGPIADLSYRNYTGLLEPPLWRWWVIAKMTMRTSIKKKGFWALAVLSAYWYVFLGVIFYFIETLGSGAGVALSPVLAKIVWRDQFLNGFNLSQLFLFVLALLIGVGTISNDSRAHALLVYLSKPCTKADYLIGKWVAIFLILAAVGAVPTFLFYGYCALSYSRYGFFTSEPFLVAKLIEMVMLPAAFHASVCLGVSSLFNQGRLAGAAYAGIYFMTGAFVLMMRAVYAVDTSLNGRRHLPQTAIHMIGTLTYASVNGLENALAKIVLDTDGSGLVPGGRGAGAVVPAPDGLPFGIVYVAICAICLLIAWSRIRAVEVVGR